MFITLNEYGASRGMQYFWWELMEKAKSTNEIFYFEDKDLEIKYLDRIRDGELHRLMENKIKKSKNDTSKLKFIIRSKYPWLISLYKKLKS